MGRKRARGAVETHSRDTRFRGREKDVGEGERQEEEGAQHRRPKLTLCIPRHARRLFAMFCLRCSVVESGWGDTVPAPSPVLCG